MLGPPDIRRALADLPSLASEAYWVRKGKSLFILEAERILGHLNAYAQIDRDEGHALALDFSFQLIRSWQAYIVWAKTYGKFGDMRSRYVGQEFSVIHAAVEHLIFGYVNVQLEVFANDPDVVTHLRVQGDARAQTALRQQISVHLDDLFRLFAAGAFSATLDMKDILLKGFGTSEQDHWLVQEFIYGRICKLLRKHYASSAYPVRVFFLYVRAQAFLTGEELFAIDARWRDHVDSCILSLPD